MTKEILIFALMIVYLSVCLGVFLKLRQYGVQKHKALYSLCSPIVLNVLAAWISWEYIKFREKKDNVIYSKKDKILFMLELIRLNIQWFPALVGFSAVTIVKIEKTRRFSKQEEKEKGYKEFSRRSYELYDDCMSYAA